MPKVDIRPVDVLIVATIGAIAVNLFKSGILWQQVAGLILVALTALISYASYSTARWISTLHLTSNVREETSIRHSRQVGRKLPCPYPDAWYAVCFSEELSPGAVLPVTVCGHNLVVFRPQPTATDRLPRPAVLDAYCSHLGAHLALGGGSVVGDCVKCPFHGWCFGTDGKLKSVPTSDTPPSNADIFAWPCEERNGIVSVWMNSRVHKAKFAIESGPSGATSCNHDGDAAAATTNGHVSLSSSTPAKGSKRVVEEVAALFRTALEVPNNEVSFQVPTFAQVNGPPGTREMVYHGFTENIVNAVLFEIPENGSDICHLHVLHREFIIPALYPLMSHKWDATWKSGEAKQGRGFIADITVDEAMCVMDYPLPGEVHVKITQCGPSQVYLDMSTPVGKLMVVETVTPVAPLQLRVLHAVYAAPTVPRLLAKIVLKSTMIQFEKDVPVWCNKKYMASASGGARIIEADRMIPTYRRWAQQFFDKNASISFEEAAKIHALGVLGLPQDAKLDW